MRRVFGVCLCLSTFAGSTTTVWATDLALPPLRPPPPTEVFAYRWSGCHAGANAGYAWSRQQETWNQSGNGAAAPAQQPAANTPAPNTPVPNPPVVANPQPPKPPVNNPPGNGGWKPPYKPPVYGHHGDKGWWHPGKPYDGDKDHKWSRYGGHEKHDRDDDHHWPQIGSKGGSDKHGDHDWPWQQQAHDKSGQGWSQLSSNGYSDRYDWLRHDQKDDHGKYAATGWAGKRQDDDGRQGGYGWGKQPSKGEHDSYAWLQPDQKDEHDKHAATGWPEKRPSDDKDKPGGYDWQKQTGYDKHDKDDWHKDGWQKHDGKHDHDGYAWKPVKPGWPPKNPPPPNNGGGQQNPPPVQGNTGGGQPPQQTPPPVTGGAVSPLPTTVLLQTPTTVSSNGSDVIGGLQIGCDTQMDRFVLGIQAMADLGVINASSNVAPQLTLNATTRNLYTATVRAGYLVTPEILAYVRGGAAWTRTSVSIVNNATGQSASAAFNRSGWTVGAGVEWMFARNWSAFAEYDYADFGTVTGTVPGAAAVTGGPNVVSQKTQIHTALVGVNYRFEMLSRGGW
ncbi:MAG: outer membrane beta-barrel protein [Bradyrhizobium sp.]